MNKDDRVFAEIFRRGSKTYFTSSIFFPAGVRRDIFYLYGFVRTADDFVDHVPQNREGFEKFRTTFETCRARARESGEPIVDRFLEISDRHRFDPRWVDAFLDSMAMDLEKKLYANLAETLQYVYGSAEVIGLMMSSILGLSPEAFPYARLLGRAMQYINFIRDIREDRQLGRTYLPAEDLDAFGLRNLGEDDCRERPESFRGFVRSQISRYRVWQKAAEQGYVWIPRRCLIPIRTAADMYAWTASEIEKDPAVVFWRKVKPSRIRIFRAALRNGFRTKRGQKCP